MGESVSPAQICAFRLKRNHLLSRDTAALTAICGDTCGIQAQLMTAAEIALWARKRGLKRGEIAAALERERALVKTSLMRQTLHLIPAEDFSLYITAVKRSRIEAVLRVMSRFGVGREEAAAAIDETVMEALRAGPRTQGELRKRIRPRASARLRAWMDRVSSVLRTPLAEGLICYGPARGQEVTYVRADQWLPKQKSWEESEAQRILLRRFLRAYGPATLADFSKWSGIPVRDAKPVWDSLQAECVRVSADERACFLLKKDENALAESRLEEPVVRLLPGFDPFLLAHAEKDQLVEAAHYKRVYRNQGWISPVVLSNGRVAGIWSQQKRGKEFLLEVEPFAPPTKWLRGAVEDEAERLAGFLETPCRVHFQS